MDQKQCKTGAFIWNLDKNLINNLYLDKLDKIIAKFRM